MLCGECLEGYAQWGGSCIPCTAVSRGYLLLVVIAVLLLVIVMHVLAQRKSDGFITIFVYFVQTAVFIVGPAQEWSWVSALSADSGSMASVCVAPLSELEQFVFLLLVPLQLLLMLGFVCWLDHVFLYRKVHRRFLARFYVPLPGQSQREQRPWEVTRPFNYNPYVRTVLALMALSYFGVARGTLHYFNWWVACL